jgi:hypothetical protein
MSACIVPDMLRGVRMSHSDDLVTIYHGSTEPITACGFHVAYYLPEVYEAARERS